MVISGYIKNNTVILDNPINLPDGMKVKIIVPTNSMKKSSGLCGIWEDERSADEIIDEIIQSRST